MINTKEKEKELLEEHYLIIIKKINEHYKNNAGFTLRDLLEDDKNNYYYIYMTKGIISSLIYFKHIRIFASYNGNKNFIYKCCKEIKEK